MRRKPGTIVDGRQALLSATLEAQWQKHVMMQAALGGWHGYHIRDSAGTIDSVHYDGAGQFPRRSDHDDAIGIPDLFLVHPTRGIVLMPELKRVGGRLRAPQENWHAWLSDISLVMSPIWRPSDEAEVSRVLLPGR